MVTLCLMIKISELYPPEMELKNTNLTTDTCTYLDLYISVYRGKYNFKSYDKRNDFPFNIINFPHLISNIPKSPAYGVFTSQLVRLCRINSNSNYFKRDINILVAKFCKLGFSSKVLLSKYFQFANRYICEWSRLGTNITSHNFIKSVFKFNFYIEAHHSDV